MDLIAPLPESTRQLVDEHARAGQVHPGLLLDKYALSWPRDGKPTSKLSEAVQGPTVKKVVLASNTPPVSEEEFQALADRHRGALAELNSTVTRCRAEGPLTLHLARASALENAGICLHPVYGFAYLPGSGLKGMARAYAETVWLAEQPDQVAAFRTIEDVFGWAPGSNWDKPWLPSGVPPRKEGDRSHSGNVVFHDAWPTKWPRLVKDILNSHHSQYYSADKDDVRHAPGDWESPIPVYFLAIAAGAEFDFPLSKRREDVDDGLLELARQWLLAGLCHLGAGAKTAAGYGTLRPLEAPSIQLSSPARASFETELELVTPAFLAGAEQAAEDCDLRPATLRGLLRWWWRTMHAGAVDTATLRTMEAAVWGDTQQGAALRLEVERIRLEGPHPRPGKKLGKNKNGFDVLDDDRDFFQQNEIQPGPQRTTQGLFYAAYGTDEMPAGNPDKRKQRWCLGPGSTWRVRITARDARIKNPSGKRDDDGIRIPKELILEQGRAALALFGEYGAAGSKSRKGFGSFQLRNALNGPSPQDVRQAARRFQDAWKSSGLRFKPGATGTPALNTAKIVVIPTPWRNAWFALDQLGATMQEFAQAPSSTGHGKHCAEKVALGLPRKIHGPRNAPLRHQQSHTRPRDLKGPKGDRYASQALYSLGRDQNGSLTIRAVIFFSDHLWNDNSSVEQGKRDSRRVLEALAEHLQRSLSERVARWSQVGRKDLHWGASATTHAAPSGAEAQKRIALPKSNDWVSAKLLPEKTKKGGWRAEHEGTGISGPIQNSDAVPGEKVAGDVLELIVRSANEREIAFRYPTDDDRAKKAEGPAPPRGRGNPRQGRRR